jgi:LacI family transcriptional regulator
MNLEDIARKAGVSRSTVSRVINNEGYVSETTRKKVMAVVEQEGFTPNPAARALVTQRTQVIGIVVPDPLQEFLGYDNPHYFSALLQNITDIAHQRDYATLLWVGHSAEDESRYYQRILKNRLMDGLLIVASVSSEEMLLKNLARNQTPFMLIGRPIHASNTVNYVAVDNARAAQQAVNHLLKLGRRRIGTITGTSDNVDSQDRVMGYQHALRLAGIPVDPNLVIEGRYSREWGYRGMQQLLDYKADAVFAGSDLIALGAMQAIQEAGLRIPDDIAVIGFDDSPLAEQVQPALTTVRQPIAQKGLLAVNSLLDLIEKRVEAPVQILLPTQLIVRESCGFVAQEDQ